MDDNRSAYKPNGPQDRSLIEIEQLRVSLPTFELGPIDLRIARGEFFVLIGPTGAGKSLLLEAMIGVIPVTAGRIRVRERDITHLPPEQRRVGIVYQDQALFPHLSVEQNITYGMRYCKPVTAKDRPTTDVLVERLSLGHLLKRSVLNLSGGERQRVALARALAVNPSVLLLDEPLSALDPNFREDIRQILKTLHRDTGITILMVTHDFAETHFLAQKLAVIREGSIEQVGSPEAIFHGPGNRFVAEFIGMHNIFRATFQNRFAQLKGLALQMARTPGADAQYLAIRPEDVHLFANDHNANPNRFEARVTAIVHKGFYCDLQLMVSGLCFKAMATSAKVEANQIGENTTVRVSIAPDKLHAM